MIRALFAPIVLGALLVAGSASAQTKFGFVDMQKALSQVQDGKNAKAKLEGKLKAKQKDFDRMQDDVKRLKDELESQGAMMKEDLKRQKFQEYQKKMVELQEFYLGNQKELQEEEAKLTKPILERMDRIVKKIGKEDNFTLIFHEPAVLYGSPSIDLTDRVIREYNAGAGK